MWSPDKDLTTKPPSIDSDVTKLDAYIQSIDVNKDQVLIFKISVPVSNDYLKKVEGYLNGKFKNYPNIEIILLTSIFESVGVQ